MLNSRCHIYERWQPDWQWISMAVVKAKENKAMKNSTLSGVMKGSNTSKYSEQSKLGTWKQSFKPRALIPVFLLLLPGKSHGQRSLAGYSPRGHKEADTTEWLTTTWIAPWMCISHISPLQALTFITNWVLFNRWIHS